MRGILLAGGSGTRLGPVTRAVCKQLLPVYDKPMIYYPLSTLMLGGIREILIITTPQDEPLFRRVLGDGSELGMELSYATQSAPRGIAEALLIGAEFARSEPVTLILGDNIFFGAGLSTAVQNATAHVDGCVLFGYHVSDPERYGVVEIDAAGKPIALVEKPTAPRSNIAVAGLYVYDGEAAEIARNLRPSGRGELEITDVNIEYLRRGRARLELLGRGMAWLDTGTFDSLLEASQFIQVLSHRQAIRVACIEEVAYRMGFISRAQLLDLAVAQGKGPNGSYLVQVASEAQA